jgi:Flp pilus assembly protein TadD
MGAHTPPRLARVLTLLFLALPLAAPAADRQEAIAAFQRQDLAAAERLSREWLAENPGDYEIHRLLGMVLVTSGMELERGAQPREQYLARYGEAVEALRRAVELGPEQQLNLDHALGFALLQIGSFAAAEERLDRALAVSPEHFVLHRLRGTARLEQGRYDEAESDLRRGVALAPDDAASRFLLARSLTLQGRHQDARAALEEYTAHIAQEPPDDRHFRALYEIAGYVLLQNDVAGALEPLQQACRLQPSAVCRTELGKLYQRLERPEDAARELDAALAQPGAPPDLRREALHHRGVLAFDAGDPERAVDLLAQALELSPNRGETLKTYGAALRQLGRRDEARAALLRFQQIVDEENEVERLRAHLTT